MTVLHIVIVDDHALVRAGLAAVLRRERDMEVVASFGDGSAFFQALPRLGRIDVALMDIDMPGVSGLLALERLNMRRDPPPVLLVSMHAQRAYLEKARALGARGFVSKASDDVDLVHAVRRVAWGDTVFPDLEDAPADDAHQANVALASLSEQERRVLILMHQGLTQQEIARDLDLSAKTVSTYKVRMMEKLGIDNLVELIRFGDAVGLNDEP